METTKFEMGPIQKLWVQSLKDHPERQRVCILGFGTPHEYKACCLGEYLLCEARYLNKPLPFIHKDIIDIHKDDSTRAEDSLLFAYERLGLRSSLGAILPNEQRVCHESLAYMNDTGYTWSEIADFIEANPERVFTKPV